MKICEFCGSKSFYSTFDSYCCSACHNPYINRVTHVPSPPSQNRSAPEIKTLSKGDGRKCVVCKNPENLIIKGEFVYCNTCLKERFEGAEICEVCKCRVISRRNDSDGCICDECKKMSISESRRVEQQRAYEAWLEEQELVNRQRIDGEMERLDNLYEHMCDFAKNLYGVISEDDCFLRCFSVLHSHLFGESTAEELYEFAVTYRNLCGALCLSSKPEDGDDRRNIAKLLDDNISSANFTESIETILGVLSQMHQIILDVSEGNNWDKDSVVLSLCEGFSKRHENVFVFTQSIESELQFVKEFTKFRELISTKYASDVDEVKLMAILGCAAYKGRYSTFKSIFEHTESVEEILELYVRTSENIEQELNMLSKILEEKCGTMKDYDLELAVRSKMDSVRLDMFEQLIMTNSRSVGINEVDLMGGLEFEQFVEDLYVRMGHAVKRTKASGDQGADLIAEKHGAKWCIQVKNYSGYVSNKAVQEVVASIAYYGADRGAVVTNSQFTESAKKLASANSIDLIGRDDLERLLGQYY